jgi:ribonuclease P protein component
MQMTHPVAARLRDKAQFQLGLDQTVVARSAHFALHASNPQNATDQTAGSASMSQGPSHLIGAMIPKRWAKRAVTRNAIRRQIYQAWSEWLGRLPAGVHVVRLKNGFPSSQFQSATSPALKAVVRQELNQLFEQRVSA